MRLLGRHFKKYGIILPFAAAASLSTAMGDTEIELIIQTFEHALAYEELTL